MMQIVFHRRRRSAQLRFWLAATVVLAALGTAGSGAQAPATNPELTEALCSACHRDRFETLPDYPHGLLDSPEWRERTGQAPACLNCHGDVSAHIGARGGQGNVFAFREEAATDQDRVCLGCHSASHPESERRALEQAGVSCASCHPQHAGEADE